MVVETKVYQKNQTTIPTVYTKKYNVEPEDIVEWRENEDGKLYVTFGFVEIPLIKKNNVVRLRFFNEFFPVFWWCETIIAK